MPLAASERARGQPGIRVPDREVGNPIAVHISRDREVERALGVRDNEADRPARGQLLCEVDRLGKLAPPKEDHAVRVVCTEAEVEDAVPVHIARDAHEPAVPGDRCVDEGHIIRWIGEVDRAREPSPYVHDADPPGIEKIRVEGNDQLGRAVPRDVAERHGLSHAPLPVSEEREAAAALAPRR